MKRPWTLSGAPVPKPRPKWVPRTFGVCRHCGRERHCVHRCRLSAEILALVEQEEARIGRFLRPDRLVGTMQYE